MSRRFLMLAFSLGAVAGCKGHGEDETAGHTVSVRTALAEAKPFPQIVTAIGTVTPRPGRFAELSAPAATRVARVLAVPGQHVNTGEVLVQFETAPFEAAARSTEAALSAARANYDRAVRLAQAGVLPRKDVDQAASELAAAQSADVTVRRSLELATLRAPLAGVVTKMTAVMGQPVDANGPLVEVVDQDALDIVFALSPEAAGQVRPGAAIAITSGENAQGESLGSGSVTSIGAAVDSASRTVAVRAQLSHPRRPLRVGETVSGRITTGVHPNAIVIPAEALVPAGDSFKVFVVGEDSVAMSRTVAVGARVDSLVEIIRGLTRGETVVTYGAYGLEDSVKVVKAGP